MADKPFEETGLYKRGEAIKELGEKMMDKNSTITDVVEAGQKAGLDLAFGFIERLESE